MEQTQFNFRLADINDFHAICQLYQLSENHSKCNFIHKWLISNHHIFHVAELGGKIVGCVAIRFPKQGEAWLSHKYIDPKIRNLGIGTEMSKYEENYTKDHGAKIIRLATKVDNYPIHWVIGEKLKFYQQTRWLRLRKLSPRKISQLYVKPYTRLIKRPIIRKYNNLLPVKVYIKNHIDYYISNKLIPYENNLTMYTMLDLEDNKILNSYKAFTIFEHNKIQATAIYKINPSTSELMIFQLFSNRIDYTIYLLFQIIQFAKKRNLYISIMSSKPQYPILKALMAWTEAPQSYYQRQDWFVFGKNLN